MGGTLIGWRAMTGIAFGSLMGCVTSPAAATYEYTELDMQQFATGTWSGNWDTTGNAGPGAMTFTLELHRPTTPGRQPLCGSRQFNSYAPQCIDVSEMSLLGVLNVGDGSLTNVQLSGQMMVPGTRLTEVFLDLTDKASDLHLSGQWENGRWTLCRAERASGIIAACTLDTLTPP